MTYPIDTLARFIADTPRDAHPESGFPTAQRAFLDTIGCILLGADTEVVRVVIDAAAPWGQGDRPILGTAHRMPAPWAALANGAAAHAYDLDDFTLVANDHPSAVMVPAILAAAEPHHAGPDLLDAFLIGLETIFRIGEAVNMGHYNLGWHTTATVDSLGATAAVCRLSGLPPDRIAAALSLTTSLSTGYCAQFGTMAKPLHAGLAAKAGLVAAALARAGATATPDALDRFQIQMTSGDGLGFDTAFRKLGQPWGIDEFGLGGKYYPSCGYTHRSIDGALELRRGLNLRTADQIASVSLSLPDFHMAILPFHTPKDETEALFSPAYCVAVALATGRCGSSDFTASAVRREDILALTARTKVTARRPTNPRINVDPNDPDTVSVCLKDGRRGNVAVPLWTGAPGRDMTPAQFDAKFRDCCLRAGTGNPDAIAAAVAGLATGRSLQDLNAVLTG